MDRPRGCTKSDTNVSFTCRVFPRHAVLLRYRYLNGGGQGEVLRQRHLHLVFHRRLVVELRGLTENQGAGWKSGDKKKKKEYPSLKSCLSQSTTCAARNLLAAMSALTLLLWKVRVSVRLRCSSALMPYWPHMASACSHAMLTSGTRITSSHTWPTLQRRLSAEMLTTERGREKSVSASVSAVLGSRKYTKRASFSQ